MKEVAGPIVATSSVLLAVFIPAAMMPGITGQLYNQFALTIAFSIVLSMINSLTLSPALCGVFLQKPHKTTFRPFVIFNEGFEYCTGRYSTFVRWLSHHWYIIAATFVIGALGVVYLLERTPTAFIPNEDQGQIYAIIQTPPGTTLERTNEISKKLQMIAKKIEGVSSVTSLAGYEILTEGRGSNAGTCLINLKDWSDRKPVSYTHLTLPTNREV